MPTHAAEAERNVVLVGSLQDELGHSGEWDPAAEATKMTHVSDNLYALTVTLPAGEYEYKVAIGSWDENYGAGGKDGSNLKLSLSEETEVTFYYHDTTHAIADSTYYKPIPKEKQPRLAGDIQPAINAGSAWSPSESTALFTDNDFDNVYTYTAAIPKGNYQYKVVLGNDWGEEYPGDNAALTVLQDEDITFFFNNNTKEVTTDYNPTGSDNAIKQSALYHDTWDSAYRMPFGAVSTGTNVTLRISTEKGDAERASVLLKNYNTGTSKLVSMKKAGTQNNKDYWEASVTPGEKGVYGYKFMIGDGSVQAEYGEDTAEGHTGKAVDKNAELFQLTVFDPGFETPNWMKEAVVYQIFPDRFYNGNPENDDNKENARGEQPIERPESWESLPDNPRLSSEANYTGDGHWGNDFFGGDVKGVHEKLDYIESLGVNTIYLNPIAHAASNHKYDATNWKEIDPMFGTPEEFEAFTNELEARGMHLILDGVFNHVADDSIYFDRYGKFKTVGAYEYWAKIYDLMNDEGLTEEQAKQKAEEFFIKDGQVFSNYGFHNWFNIKNEKISDSKESKEGETNERYDYQAWWGFDSLPEIKSIPGDAVGYDSELNNKLFANYIMYEDDSAAKGWITNGGSGWRLDVANEVDMEFWREFRKELKADDMTGAGATLKEGEQPLILGEIWDDASKYFLGDQYDSVMNYRFERAVMSFLKNGNASQTDAELTAVQEDYPKEAAYALMNLMGSHDTPRAIFLLGGGTDSYERAEFDPNYNHELGVKRLKLASIFQMGYPGAPTIYYGDEAGVTGSKDPDDRRTYPWGNGNQDLIAHYQKIGAVREANSNLFAYGDLETLYADGDVYVYARTNDEKAAVVAINRGTSAQTIELDVKGTLKNGIKLSDALNTNYRVTSGDSKLAVEVPAMSGRMLMSDDNQNLALPAGVANVTAEAGTGEVTLSWTGAAAKYKVYQSNLKGALYEEVTETADPTVTIDSLTNGTPYFFAVTAVDENGNESMLTETKEAAVPHYKWTDGKYWLGNVTALDTQTLDLSVSHTISAEVFIEGATEKGHAEGLQAEMQLKAPNETEWQALDAAYVSQNGNNNMFSASFRPLETGDYSYRFRFTTDNGAAWKTSEEKTVTFTQDAEDTTAPASAVTLDKPVQESGRVNLAWSLENSDQPFLTAVERDGELITLIEDPAQTAFTDYEVENGKNYTYRVTVYDQAGNSMSSNEISITPDIVMVEVTFKMHAPAYTPLNTKVTIPNSLNGWSTGAWEMSRNGAVTPDWEITKELQEGTVITYKYVKGESWDQEGLADHTRNDKSDDDMSFYGYGAEGTDLQVVVENQGNNKMVINDEVLRWIDQPVVISEPQDGAVTDRDSITVKGNAIKEGVLTINGEAVTINNDMTFSHNVKLTNGENNIKITIEPSAENKETVFNNSGDVIAKNTKEYNLTVTSTAGGSDNPGDDKTVTFSDISSHWAKAEIEKLASKEIIKGFPDGTFAPEQSVTRAELSALLIRILGLTEGKGDKLTFKDVKGDEWFAGALQTAVNAGLVDGFTDGTFKPNELVTREQAASMIREAMKFANYDAAKLDTAKKVDRFKDSSDIANWAKENVEILLQAGMMEGNPDGSFKPKAHTTRAEAAAILANFLAKS
ncbi:amylopullulanase [Bacillus taeanensis]|uniref:starch synthase (maltosyl-transferring) n=2 Tax=Bacillus taeanensis TaxID=273032 RepID=A0A366XYE1_9BACI|nr:alpha amylase N-terminal ig-like domain-containing protein [Bacillus taeanensis]RBW68941.1 amylopullulanase [Bacillus taeanensis]